HRHRPCRRDHPLPPRGPAPLRQRLQRPGAEPRRPHPVRRQRDEQLRRGGPPGGEGLPPASRLAGLIPTGWYPRAVLASADGKRLFVANVKGVGSLARRKTGEKAPRAEAKGRNSHDHQGSVSIIDVPGEERLAEYTRTVNANNRLAYSLAGLGKP